MFKIKELKLKNLLHILNHQKSKIFKNELSYFSNFLNNFHIANGIKPWDRADFPLPLVFLYY